MHPVIDQFRDEIRRTSLGGFPMLITAAAGWAVTAALTYVLPVKTAALVMLFQGMLVMPIGLWLLPKWMGLAPLPRDHDFTPLLIQCASVQAVALPAVIIVFALQPLHLPAALAAIVGGHFLPYAWLQRHRAYLGWGVAVGVGPWLLTLFLGRQMFHLTGFWVAACLAALAFTMRADVRAEERRV